MTAFRRLWLAQTVSLLGDFVAVFAVQVAVAFRMHGSARDMAGVFIAGLIPGIILGPFAGVFADRCDPRRTMIASDLGRAGLVLLLAFAQHLPQFWAISFAIGCVSSFFGPALAITVPLLVPADDLVRAIARMQQSMQVVRIASPAIAAALAASLGERACYYADSASFVFSATLLATLPCSRPSGRFSERHLSAGIRFLITEFKFSFVILTMTAATFAAGCFGALAAVYVRDILHCGPPVLAMISSLIGAGTMAGSAILSRLFHRFRNPVLLLSGGVFAVGVSILVFAALRSQSAALLASAVMGLGVAAAMVASATILQGQTPPGLRGRISGISASATTSAQLVAMLLAGAGAEWIGVRCVFAVSALLLLVTGFIAARMAPCRSALAPALNNRSGQGDS